MFAKKSHYWNKKIVKGKRRREARKIARQPAKLNRKNSTDWTKKEKNRRKQKDERKTI